MMVLKKLLLVGEIFFGLILALVIIVSFIPLVPPFKNYYHSRTVLTGSMEPKLPKGSVVINQWADQKNLKVGDVITYQHPNHKKIIYITHRIVKIDKTGLLWRFKTKGDANPSSDFGLVTQVNTEGKVILTIPLIGYLIEFFKTPMGFILLIALPLLIFIVRQTRDVLQMWKKQNAHPAPVVDTKSKRRKSAKRKTRKALVTTIFLALSFLAARISFVTYASFTSGQATITGVTLNTAASFPGDVVINELMRMGTTNSENDPTSPLPSLSPSPTPELSLTPSPAPTLESESSLNPSPTPSPEVSPTPTPSSTPEISPTSTPTIEPSPTPSPQSTLTPAPTSEPTPTLTPTPSPASELSKDY